MMYDDLWKEVMSVFRTNIYLDQEQVRALKHLAAEDRCSMAELVRRAVDTYVATRLADQTVWRERLEDFLTRVRSEMPADIPPEQIEADITAAREEVRQAHRAAGSLRSRSNGSS